jgi:hypothetical protein
MSCTPKLLSYYSNKVNIYDSNCFIKLPDWKSCPAPPCIYLAPPCQPNLPPAPPPMYRPGSYCGQNISYYTGYNTVGTEVPCNAQCGTAPQSIGCPTCPTSVSGNVAGCSSCR